MSAPAALTKASGSDGYPGFELAYKGEARVGDSASKVSRAAAESSQYRLAIAAPGSALLAK